VVFFKLQLILFFEGLRSERQLMRVVADRLSLRWYLGYDFGEPLPDHSSLTRIRERYGLALFERFFDRVVELCQEAGLVWGQELYFDATKVRANADLDSLVPRFYWNAKEHLAQHIADLFASGEAPEDGEETHPADAAEMLDGAALTASCDPIEEESRPTRLPSRLAPELEAQLAEENQSAWKLLAERRLDPDRPPLHGYQRQTELRVSPTDPDAALMYDGRKAALGYHDHYVVDGGKARIIVGALVTPADVMENTPMPDLLWRVCFRWKLRPRQATGDTTYATIENIRALEDAGIRAYLPLADWDRTPFYGPSRFTYDPARDAYRCPQGELLTRARAKRTEDVVVYQADPARCNACPVKRACTTSDQGRIIHRSFYAAYLERVKAYHATAAYARAMNKRKVWVEPLFGEAKDWHGLRRFRLRGLENVNIEGLLTASGQNLKRLLRDWGWGRRPWPAGGVGYPARISVSTFVLP
jgi:hypothetical protein